MTKREYGGAMLLDHPPDEPPWDGCAPFFLAKELDRLPLDTMGPIVSMRDPFNPEFEIICANPYHNNIERIGSFKQFLMGRFYSDYISFLKTKIEEGSLRIGKRSSIVPQPDSVLVSKAEVERIDLYRKSAEELYVDIIMSATIHVVSERDGTFRSDDLTQWFRIRTCSELARDSASFNNLLCVMVYDRFEPAPGIALDEYLVPYTSATLIDDESTGILAVYYPEALEKPCRIDGETLAGRMGLQIKLYRLADDDGIRGQIYFEEHSARVLNENGEAVNQAIPANTVLVNSSLCYGDDGFFSEERLNDTIIHECYHAYRHRLFYLGQCLYNSDLRCLSCTVIGQQIGAMIDSGLEAFGTSTVEGLPLAANCFYGKTPIDWMEWQANRATPRIRMPAPTAELKIEELLSYYKTRYPGISTPRLFSRIIADFADFYRVSKQSAKRRLIELGYEEAKGVLNYVNGRYAIDYEFSPGSLGSNQTFTIDFESAIDLYRNDDSFRECVGTGLYQYVDDHFCLADSRYIYRRNGTLHLTSYAKSHMDECCLVFTLRSAGPEYSYREGTLLKETSSGGTAAEFDGQRLEVDYFAAAQRLSGIINDLPRSPCGTLKAHMDRRKITVEALVAKSGVSEKTIKRLRSDPEYTPTKRNALAICIGLQLEPMLQRDWMGKLGIVMTASTTDVFYELLMGSLYKQPLSVFNEKLQEHGYSPLSRCVDELDS